MTVTRYLLLVILLVVDNDDLGLLPTAQMDPIFNHSSALESTKRTYFCTVLILVDPSFSNISVNFDVSFGLPVAAFLIRWARGCTKAAGSALLHTKNSLQKRIEACSLLSSKSFDAVLL